MRCERTFSQATPRASTISADSRRNLPIEVMGHRRDLIRMSEDEALAFLRAHRRLQVATLNSDGSAHLSTVWYAMHEVAPCFVTYTKTQKIVNLRRDPRITVSVDTGDDYESLQGVVVYGLARLLTDLDALPYLRQIVGARDHQATVAEIEQQSIALADKRTVVVVQRQRMVSWDHRKLKGIY